jgi:hypothetical protein
MKKDTLRRIKYELEFYDSQKRKTKQMFRTMLNIISELADNSLKEMKPEPVEEEEEPYSNE